MRTFPAYDAATFMQCAVLVPQPGDARALRQAARRKAQKAVAMRGGGVSDPGTSVDEDSDED